VCVWRTRGKGAGNINPAPLDRVDYTTPDSITWSTKPIRKDAASLTQPFAVEEKGRPILQNIVKLVMQYCHQINLEKKLKKDITFFNFISDSKLNTTFMELCLHAPVSKHNLHSYISPPSGH
jgi:hypothetical protein